MSFDLDALGLNPNQLTAVKWQEGPLLVLAGPGSGKTKVLTCRIARLLADSTDERFKILGITFTNKAATEMRSRIDLLVSEGRERATLTTFHAFAAEILRQHGSHVGLKPDFSILSEQADREAVLTEAIRSSPSDDEDFKPKAAQLLPLVSRMLDECVLPDEASTYLASQRNGKEIAGIYGQYREKLIAANQMDFGSLLALAVDLLEKKPAIAKQVRRVYSYVCVDECQDTNSAQFRLLVQLVAEKSPNLFVVADDDQLIFQWNGASPARLSALRDRYNTTILQLPENYRCPPDVIEMANNLILHNEDRTPDKQPLRAHKTGTDDGSVTLEDFDNFKDELLWIAKRLGEMAPDDRANSVILARRKKLLEDCVETLTSKSVPAYIAIRKNEFQSAPYKWLHSGLRLANAPQDREQLRRFAKAFFQLEGVGVDVDEVVARAAVDGEGFLRAWLNLVMKRDGLESSTRSLLTIVKKSLADRLDYWAFVAAAHEWFASVLDRPTSSEGTAFDEFADEKEIWDALLADIGQHTDLKEQSLHTFLQELDLRGKEKPAPKGAVRCLTIAASKGMEFKHVFILGMVEDELPGYHAKKKGDRSDEMREERRNCFVAITRAEETLTLTLSKQYYGYFKQPSRFLSEMAGNAK